MPQLYPTLQGVSPSWADISVKASVHGGALIDGADVKDVSWNEKVDIGMHRGPGSRVMNRTTGQLTSGAKATFYRSGYDVLLEKLADVAPKRGDEYLISLATFDWLLQWTPPGSSRIFRVEILGCRVAGDEGSSAEGPDAETIAVELNPARIIRYDAQGRKIVLL